MGQISVEIALNLNENSYYLSCVVFSKNHVLHSSKLDWPEAIFSMKTTLKSCKSPKNSFIFFKVFL